MSGIEARADFAALAAGLVQHAETLGTAHAAAARTGRSDPLQVWRQARLLWPLFTKG